MPVMQMDKFYGFTPSEFKKILGDLDLKMYSGHVDFGMKDGMLQKKTSRIPGNKQWRMPLLWGRNLY